MAVHANSTPAPTRRPTTPIIVDRRKVATVIERLIAILDDLDGEPDLETNGDEEPSLGASEGPGGWTSINTDDREADLDLTEADCESYGFDGEEPEADGPETYGRGYDRDASAR